MRLTKRELDVLHFIEKYQNENGWSPTIREIAKAIEIESTSTVHTYLKRLEAKEYIQRMVGAPRAIKLLKTYDMAA